MPPSAVQVREVSSPEDLRKVKHLREEVFIREQNVPVKIEMDEWDATAAHFIAEDGAEVVACARALEKSPGVVKIGRVAVPARLRGRDYGRAVMEFVHEWAGKKGYRKAWLSAQKRVEPFYHKLGYRTISDVYMEADIEHVAMERDLSACSGVQTLRCKICGRDTAWRADESLKCGHCGGALSERETRLV